MEASSAHQYPVDDDQRNWNLYRKSDGTYELFVPECRTGNRLCIRTTMENSRYRAHVYNWEFRRDDPSFNSGRACDVCSAESGNPGVHYAGASLLGEERL